MSVCSDKLIRTRRWPATFASAAMSVVLPTPGEPSSITGFGTCIARSTRSRFPAVVCLVGRTCR